MEPRTVYVFLAQREHDKRAWPCVYEDRELAERAPSRVTAIAEVSFDENGNACAARVVPWGSDRGGGGGERPLNPGSGG